MLVCSVPARAVVLASTAVTGITLLVSFIFAMALGHVSHPFPTISDFAVKSPELHMFRFGMMVAAVFLVAVAVIVYAATNSSYSLSVGTLLTALMSALSLGIAAVVSKNESTSVHTGNLTRLFTARFKSIVIVSDEFQDEKRL